MRKLWFVFPAVLIVVLDQLTKHWCVNRLDENVPVRLIDHFLYLTLTYNSRGAFSLFPLPGWLFIVITGALLAGITYYALAFPSGIFLSIFLGMLAGGGAGNFIDRLRFGRVIDFLDLRWWPVFNLADSAITVSIAAIVIYFLFQKK